MVGCNTMKEQERKDIMRIINLVGADWTTKEEDKEIRKLKTKYGLLEDWEKKDYKPFQVEPIK